MCVFKKQPCSIYGSDTPVGNCTSAFDSLAESRGRDLSATLGRGRVNSSCRFRVVSALFFPVPVMQTTLSRTENKTANADKTFFATTFSHATKKHKGEQNSNRDWETSAWHSFFVILTDRPWATNDGIFAFSRNSDSIYTSIACCRLLFVLFHKECQKGYESWYTSAVL